MESLLLVSVILVPLSFSAPKYNVLFIVSDDLRADLGGFYGNQDIIYTPNIDAFQNRAFTFTHAYTQQALCGPTRASFLTGTRPDTTRIWNIGPYFRDRMVNGTGKTVITLPQYFKEYGNYLTIGSGKVFHPWSASGGCDFNDPTCCNMGDDLPYSWSTNYGDQYWDCDQYGNGLFQSTKAINCTNGTGCLQPQSCFNCLSEWNCYIPDLDSKVDVVCPADCPNNCFPDAAITDNTLKYFADLTDDGHKQPDKPFFIAVGFKRPHMGFFDTLSYYQQYGYNNNYSNIQIAKHRTIPQNAPIKATNNASGPSSWRDVEPYLYYVNYTDPTGKKGVIRYINDSYHSHLIAGYFASVSFMDQQFGRIIQGLYEYGLWNNTVIAFTGDHGWHLGEQGCWAKFTNFEVSVRVPLIIRIPGMNEGKKSDVLVEQLDIFPTLIEASGLGFNSQSNITQQLEGKSLVKFIKNPDLWENYYAYSQYPRSGGAPDFNIMGVSMRTPQWRYTEWIEWNPGNNKTKGYPVWNGKKYGIELYNHSNNTINENDMNGYDNYNLAYDDQMKDIVQKLHNELVQTWDNQSWAINKFSE